MKLHEVLEPIRKYVSAVKDRHKEAYFEDLVSRGLKIGKNVFINNNVSFDDAYPYLIEIEDNCRISEGVRFLAHDATTFWPLGVTRIARVRILEGSFIGERAIILPGVTIGPRALIGAGSVVNRDIGENRSAAGNPARPYGKFSDLLDKYRTFIHSENVVDFNKILKGLVSPDDVCAMVDKHGVGFVGGLSDSPFTKKSKNADIQFIRQTITKNYEDLIAQCAEKDPNSQSYKENEKDRQ